MNGFLSPSGEFYECEFGKHDALAYSIIERDRVSAMDEKCNMIHSMEDRLLKNAGYLYFGNTGDLGDNTDSYVHADNSNVVVSQLQCEWVDTHLTILTSKQLTMFNDLLEESEED